MIRLVFAKTIFDKLRLSRALAIVVALAGMSANVAHATLQKPSWVTPQEISTNTGVVQLEWRLKRDHSAEFFQITEQFQEQVYQYYVEDFVSDLYRSEVGVHTFRVATCKHNVQLKALCGAQSDELRLTVTEEIHDKWQRTISPVDPIPPGVGGAQNIQPGSWHAVNPDTGEPSKPGTGWSFFGANRSSHRNAELNRHQFFRHFPAVR